MGVLEVVIIVTVTVIFFACELPGDRPQTTPVTPAFQATVRRTKRSASGKINTCLNYYGGVELDYVTGSTTSFTFDLCAVINCGGQNYRIYDIWVCYQLSFNRYCQQGWTRLSGRCAWSEVVGHTGNWKPQSQNQEGWGDRFYSQRDFRIPQNLVTLSLGKWTAPPTGIANRVVYFTLGVDVVGEDPYGVVKVNFRNSLQGLFPTPAPLFENFTGIMEVDYTKLKPRQLISMATG